MCSRFVVLALRQPIHGLKRCRTKPISSISRKYLSSSPKTWREGPGLKEFMPSSAKEDVDVEPLSIAPYLKPNELSGDGRKGKLSLSIGDTSSLM